MANLIIPTKTGNDNFKLGEFQNDLKELNNKKVEKGENFTSPVVVEMSSFPSVLLDSGRGKKSGITWNSNVDNDYGVNIKVDGKDILNVRSDGTVQVQLPDGSWNPLELGAKNKKTVNVTSAIQSALDYLNASGGGTLYLQSGTYILTSTLKFYSNTNIIGMGRVILKRTTGMNLFITNGLNGTETGYTGTTNVLIDNIEFECESSNETYGCVLIGHTENVRIHNCRFKNINNTWHFLEVNSSKRCIVDNCTFENYLGNTEALQLDYSGGTTQYPTNGLQDDTHCRDIIITRCRFTNINGKAIGNHSFKAGVMLKNIKINNCVFENVKSYCLNLRDVDGYYIEHNHFVDVAYAMFMQIEQNIMCNIYILNNYYENNNKKSLDDGAYDGRFLGLSDNANYGIWNVVIKGNYIYGAFRHGIGILAKSVDISDNYITACGKNGLYIYGGTQYRLSNNTIRGNNVDNDGVSQDMIIGNNATTQTAYVFINQCWFNYATIGTNYIAIIVQACGFLTLTNGNGSYITTVNNWVNGTFKATGV